MRTLNFSTSKICRYLVPYDTTEFDDAIFEVSCTVSSNDTMYIAKYDGCGRHRRWEHTQMFEYILLKAAYF